MCSNFAQPQDFITIVSHYMVHNDNQRVIYNNRVALGGASKKNVYLCTMYVRKKHNRSGSTKWL